MNSDTAPARKDDLRRQLQAARVERTTALDADQRSKWAGVVADLLEDVAQVSKALSGHRGIASYEAYPSEPPTSEFNARVVGGGSTLWLPSFRNNNGDLTDELSWAVDATTDLHSSEDAVAQFAVVIVPALAATIEGARIGKGKGYYDRFLNRAASADKPPFTVAVVSDDELLPVLPVESHDMLVDLVIAVPSPS